MDERTRFEFGDALRGARKTAPDADALQAIALADLMSGDTTANTIERSISLLEMSARLAPTAARYADLSAAQLAYASSRGGATALVNAMDAAGRALDLEPVFPAALFNRALALDLVGLDTEAAKQWRAYLDVDSSSIHSAEARRRLAALAALAPTSAPAAGAMPDEYRAYARVAPAEAQQLAWESLLGAWGGSVMSDDASAARLKLDQLKAIATQLESDGRDASVAEAVRAIVRTNGQPHQTHMLARAHRQFARAQDHARVNAYAAADSMYRELLGSRLPSAPLDSRVSLAHANALIYARQVDSAMSAALAFLRVHDGTREPLLHGRAHWYVGILQLRQGRSEPGLQNIAAARTYYERAGDIESIAGTIGVESEVAFQSGDVAAGYEKGRQALRMMRGRLGSLWRHNQLLTLSRATTRSGFILAAIAIEDEDANGVEHGTRVVSMVEAKLARARSAWRRGRVTEADDAIEDARAAIAGVADEPMRMQLVRDVNLTRAETVLRAHPESAATLLTVAIDVDRPLNYPVKLIPALVARAGSFVALRQPQRAEQDLSDAATRFDAARTTIQSAALQRGIATQARGVYDSLVLLRLRAGNVKGALAALERSRVTFGSLSTPVLPTSERRRSDAIVDYALIGDELLSWTLISDDTVFRRSRINRRELAARIERVRSGLELGASDESLRADLATLYDILVRPLANELVGDRIRIIADGELSKIPFAALWNSRARRYLAEEYVTSLAPTLADAETSLNASVPRGIAAIVATPALDGTVFSQLPLLHGADEEATAAAAFYPGAVVLRGSQVDSASVASVLARAGMLHFAGHAILDDAQPWRSRLAVRPHGLSATAIAAMDLRRVRLVVLSACETMRAPSGDAGGFAGLTDAFLAAGVSGVVGSLWRVRDQDAARLMTAFHRAYRSSGDAAGALRAAQMALLEKQLSPSVWAAFRYAGK